MFLHKMKYTFKFLFRSKMLVFWTFIFPLVLGTCFYFAFKDIESNESLKVFDIAVVQNDEYNSNIYIKNTIEYLSEDNEDKIFNVKYVDLKKAEKLLENKDIVGYLKIDEEPNIVVNDNGINETIFKSIVEEAYTKSKIMDEYMMNTQDYSELSKKAKELSNNNDYTVDKTNENISYTMIEYYTLIAMTALYSGMLAIAVINNEMANISSKGKRNSIAPVSKTTSILASLSATYIVGVIGLALLFLYTIFALDVDYGSNILRVIIIGLIGVLAGESMGVFIGTHVKKNENSKTGILIGVTMAGSFFAGMMGITMKYIIDTNLRILNLINPAAMITDGLYSLYYYRTFTRYNYDLISLIIFSLILIILSIVKIRRVKYDSI